VKAKGMRGRRRGGMGSTPPQAVLFIGGSTKSIRCGSSTVQYASTALSQEVREKIKVDFSRNKTKPRPKSEFRSLAKKTTSGRRDGKSFGKPPRHINIGLFGKSFCQIDQVHDRRERTLHGLP
jgi:hypothetical protein